MAREAQMRPWAAAVFVADIALADIAGQDEDLLRGIECSSVAKSHIRLPVMLCGREQHEVKGDGSVGAM